MGFDLKINSLSTTNWRNTPYSYMKLLLLNAHDLHRGDLTSHYHRLSFYVFCPKPHYSLAFVFFSADRDGTTDYKRIHGTVCERLDDAGGRVARKCLEKHECSQWPMHQSLLHG